MKRLAIAIYDPHRLDPEDFLAGFVARGELADFLLEKLRKLPAGAAADHQLVVGQRGMGKTSLLRRLAIGIERDEALSQRYIPLTFREEQYNVRFLDRFWRNCGEALAEWCDRTGRAELASDLDRRLATPAWCDARAAVEAFRIEAAMLGGRPVLFVDNLDIILNALPADDHWSLRRTLQAAGGPILYGAAVQIPQQSGQQDAAFYEFFHPHVLEPLSEQELLRCLYRFADAREEAGDTVRAVLARDPGRLRTLHTLTGGNPRVLALVYQLLERAESDTVFADLEALLDQLTPFYKARVEEYQTELPRAVIDAIALNWDPITSNRLAQKTAEPVTTISSQLSRLKNDGLVEEVQMSGARAGYQLVERFFNIWYLMRHGTRRTRQKMLWLTAFLRSFYAPDELRRMSVELDTVGHPQRHPLYREALYAALEIPASSIEATLAIIDAGLSESPSKLASQLSQNLYMESSEPAALVAEGFAWTTSGHPEKAIRTFDEAIAQSGTASGPAGRVQLALALAGKALAAAMLLRGEEVLAIVDDLAARFGSASEPALRMVVAAALVGKGAAVAALGRNEEAIAIYDDVISRFGAPEPEPSEVAAGALLGKGGALTALGRSEEAIAIYNELIARFGTESGPGLRMAVAEALVRKGHAAATLSRKEKAIAAYDEVICRFGGAGDRALYGQVGRALVGKAAILASLGRDEEAFVVYDDVVNRFAAAIELDLREQVGRALISKAARLVSLGRSNDAIRLYDNVLDRFGTAIELKLREQVGGALVNKGLTFTLLSRNEEAIAIYDEVSERFGAAPERGLRIQVARAFVGKGLALRALGRNEDAVAICDDAATHFGDIRKAPATEIVWALINKAGALDALGRHEEAITAYDDVVGRFGSASDPAVRGSVVGALVSKGQSLAELRRSEEAAAAYRRALEMDPQRAEIWISLGNLLTDHLGHFDQAESAYLKAMRDSHHELYARVNLAWLFLALSRTAEAANFRSTLGTLDGVGLALLDAAFDIAGDNFGAATEHLDAALGGNQEALTTTFFDDLLRLLRLAEARGYGEKLIVWFEESGHAERQAPVYAAFVAFVRGGRFLRDVSPEVRKPAEKIYAWLTSRRKNEQQSAAQQKPKPQRRRGRPRKRRSG